MIILPMANADFVYNKDIFTVAHKQKYGLLKKESVQPHRLHRNNS